MTNSKLSQALKTQMGKLGKFQQPFAVDTSRGGLDRIKFDANAFFNALAGIKVDEDEEAEAERLFSIEMGEKDAWDSSPIDEQEEPEVEETKTPLKETKTESKTFTPIDLKAMSFEDQKWKYLAMRSFAAALGEGDITFKNTEAQDSFDALDFGILPANTDKLEEEFALICEEAYIPTIKDEEGNAIGLFDNLNITDPAHRLIFGDHFRYAGDFRSRVSNWVNVVMDMIAAQKATDSGDWSDSAEKEDQEASSESFTPYSFGEAEDVFLGTETLLDGSSITDLCSDTIKQGGFEKAIITVRKQDILNEIDKLVERIKEIDYEVKKLNDSLVNMTNEQAEEENKKIAAQIFEREQIVEIIEGSLKQIYRDEEETSATSAIKEKYAEITKRCYTPDEYATKTGKILRMTHEQEDAMMVWDKGIIAAGAGSGKTRVIAGRVVWLTQEKNVQINRILATSFTKKSAKELKERINLFSKQVNPNGGGLPENSASSSFGTTHSIAFSMLRNLGKNVRPEDSVTDDLIKLAIQQVLLYPSEKVADKVPSFSGVNTNLAGINVKEFCKVNGIIFDENIRTAQVTALGQWNQPTNSPQKNDLKATNYIQRALDDFAKTLGVDVTDLWRKGIQGQNPEKIPDFAKIDYRIFDYYKCGNKTIRDFGSEPKIPKSVWVLSGKDYPNYEYFNAKGKSTGKTSTYHINKPLNKWFNIGPAFEVAVTPFGGMGETKNVSLYEILQKVRISEYHKVISELYQDLKTPEQAFYEVIDIGGALYPRYTLDEVAVYAAFIEMLDNDGLFSEYCSFDSMLVEATRLLLSPKKSQKAPYSGGTALEYAGRLYDHIMVDEAQDLNTIQHIFFGLLAGYLDPKTMLPYPDKRLRYAQTFLLIGDDKQAIYEFRGATPKAFVSKSKIAPPGASHSGEKGDFDTKLLVTNFRSGAKIVSAANKLILNNDDQIRMQCITTPANGAGVIHKQVVPTVHEYASALATEILAYAQRGGKYKDYGILTRSNGQIESLVYALESKMVPTISKKDPYTSKPFKSIFPWLRLIDLLINRPMISYDQGGALWEAYIDEMHNLFASGLWEGLPFKFGFLSKAKEIFEQLGKDARELLLLPKYTNQNSPKTIVDIIVGAVPGVNGDLDIELNSYGNSPYFTSVAGKSKVNFTPYKASKHQTSSWNRYKKAIMACYYFVEGLSNDNKAYTVTGEDVWNFLLKIEVMDKDTLTEEAIKYYKLPKTTTSLTLKEVFIPSMEAEKEKAKKEKTTESDQESAALEVVSAMASGGDSGIGGAVSEGEDEEQDATKEKEDMLLISGMVQTALTSKKLFSGSMDYLKMRASIAENKRTRRDKKKDDSDAHENFDAVLVDTIHQWKGLEAKYVIAYLPNSFPIPLFALLKAIEKRGDIDGRFTRRAIYEYPNFVRAERRLAYVALTRGQDQVRCFSKPSETSPNSLSYFLDEAGVPDFTDVEDMDNQIFIPQLKYCALNQASNISLTVGVLGKNATLKGVPISYQLQFGHGMATSSTEILPKNSKARIMQPYLLTTTLELDVARTNPQLFEKLLETIKDKIKGQNESIQKQNQKLAAQALRDEALSEKSEYRSDFHVTTAETQRRLLKELSANTKLLTYFDCFLLGGKSDLVVGDSNEFDRKFMNENTAAITRFIDAKVQLTQLKNRTSREVAIAAPTIIQGYIQESSPTSIATKTTDVSQEFMALTAKLSSANKKPAQNTEFKDPLNNLDQYLLNPFFHTMNSYLRKLLFDDDVEAVDLLKESKGVFEMLIWATQELPKRLQVISDGFSVVNVTVQTTLDLRTLILQAFFGGQLPIFADKKFPTLQQNAKIISADNNDKSCLLPNIDIMQPDFFYADTISGSFTEYLDRIFDYFFQVFFVLLKCKINMDMLTSLSQKATEEEKKEKGSEQQPVALSQRDMLIITCIQKLYNIKPQVFQKLVLDFRKSFTEAKKELTTDIKTNPSPQDNRKGFWKLLSALNDYKELICFGQDKHFVCLTPSHDFIVVSESTPSATIRRQFLTIDGQKLQNRDSIQSVGIDEQLEDIPTWLQTSQIMQPDIAIELPKKCIDGIYGYLDSVDARILKLLGKSRLKGDRLEDLRKSANDILERLCIMLEIDLKGDFVTIMGQNTSDISIDEKRACFFHGDSLFDKYGDLAHRIQGKATVLIKPMSIPKGVSKILVEIELADIIPLLDNDTTIIGICDLNKVEPRDATTSTLNDYLTFYPARDSENELDFACVVSPALLKVR